MSTTTKNEARGEVWSVPMIYPPTWSDEDLERLEFWAGYCLTQQPRSRLLAAYLACVVRLELERRSVDPLIGGEVLEVAMTALHCERWSNAEVAAGLSKCNAIVQATEGEVHELMRRLHTVLLTEACFRLDPQDTAGIAAEWKQRAEG